MTIAMRRDAQMPTEETTVRGASEATVRYDPDGRMRGKPNYTAAQGGAPNTTDPFDHNPVPPKSRRAGHIVMDDQPNTTIQLLAEAKEFVADLSRKEKSHECFATTGMYIPPAEELRRQAEKIEQRDAMIERARQLLPKIEEILRR
jgi:hypothetical protein